MIQTAIETQKGFDKKGTQKWSASKFSDEILEKLKEIGESSASIEEIVSKYKQLENTEYRNSLYNIIDLWSMKWRDYWFTKFAEICNLSDDEFNSEYRIAVLESVRDFDVNWSKLDNNGRTRKPHFNGLLYLKLYHKFVDYINNGNRVSRKKSFKCPHCETWITTITNKHCVEFHSHSLADFYEMYPNYNNSSRDVSLDDEYHDESVKDNIDGRDDNEKIEDFIESIKHIVNEEEMRYLKDTLVYSKTNHRYGKNILDALKNNKKLYQHLIRMTVGE